MSFCLPLLGMLASTGMQMAGAQQAQAAAARATNAELDRQKGYQKQATDVFNASLAKSTPQAAQATMDAGAAQRTADYAKQQSVPLVQPGTVPFGGASSRLVSTPGSSNQDFLANAAKARLAGYTEWDLQQGIKDMQAERQLGTIGNFSRGSENVLPLELQSASHAGDTLSGIGSLIGMVSSLYGMKGLSAASAPVAQASLGNIGGLATPSWALAAPPLNAYEWAASQIPQRGSFSPCNSLYTGE